MINIWIIVCNSKPKLEHRPKLGLGLGMEVGEKSWVLWYSIWYWWNKRSPICYENDA